MTTVGSRSEVITVAGVRHEPTNQESNHPIHRSVTRRVLGVAAGLSLVVAFGVGCGSSGESTGGASTTASADGSGGGDGSSGCATAENGTIEVVTTNFDFDPDCITTSGDRLKVTYDNKEDGVKHNIHFKDAKSSTGDAKTDLKAGPDVQTITLVDLKPGETYTYVCDIHSSMKGELTVK